MYKVLYRKYRPSKLSEVVGQEVIIKILKKILESASIPHSFIFSGTRGIGKTTIARIFAKAINCEKLTSGDVCGKCQNCQAIEQEQVSDIVEIDGASNNGVDEIRELRDKCVFLPQSLKYKVYIIDEVHMLTTAAFNALLKTLEEPPKHVVFILATTEPHKIPKTIQSRCMNFSFKTLTVDEIESQILNVSKLEKIKIEKDAANLIAKSADGAMRDALVLLDKAVAYADSTITKETVLEIIGGVSENSILEIIVSLDEGKLTEAISLLEKLLTSGKSENSIIVGLIDNFKEILLKISTESNNFQKLTKAKVLDIFSELNALVKELRYTNSKQNMLIVTLIKIFSIINKTNPIVFAQTQPASSLKPAESTQKNSVETNTDLRGEMFISNPVGFESKAKKISKDRVASPHNLTELDFKDLRDNAKKKFRELADEKFSDSRFLKSAEDPDISGLSFGNLKVVLSSATTILLSVNGESGCIELYKKDKYPLLLKEVNKFLPEIKRVILLSAKDADSVFTKISAYIKANSEFIPNDFTALIEKYAAYDKILKEVKTQKFDASAVFGTLPKEEK